jgi:hypothetical protein
MKMNIEKLTHSLAVLCCSLASPKGGEGRGEEAKVFRDQIPSPQPSPRLGGERESESVSKCAPKRLTRTRLVLIGCWKLNVECSMLLLAFLILPAVLPLRAQTNVSATNTLPALAPPYGELPPTFWEQHGTSSALAGLGLIALVGSGLWLFLRPKPKTVIPPEVEALEALEKLRQQTEDGEVLSRVSQVVRNYFIAAFQLAPGELTTTEFSHELARCEKINSELSTAAADFLRSCDDRKFSTTTGLTRLDAANRALNLIEKAEQRRAQLHQAAETQTESPRA